jgi:hypothetical protein
MSKELNMLEKLAIDTTPGRRLAVRLRNMYGKFEDTEETIRKAEKIHRILGNNKTDILQKSLEHASTPLGRIGKVGPYSIFKGYNKK